MRTWTVNEPVFQSCFSIRLGGTRQQAFDYYCRRNGLDPKRESTEDLNKSRALATVFSQTGYKNFIIWLREVPDAPDAKTMGLIAHESLHGALHVLRFSGLYEIAEASEESFSYYTEFVVREIYRRLWPAKEKSHV